jgi:hypothetical protein
MFAYIMDKDVEILGCHHCHQDYACNNFDMMDIIVTGLDDWGWGSGPFPRWASTIKMTRIVGPPANKVIPTHPT